MLIGLRRLLLALTALLLAAVGLALATVHPRYFFGTIVGDDAGYYLAIARNVCLGHGLSFDRLHPTNGFNPLLTLLLVALDRLFASGYGLIACFRIGTLLTWAVLVAGAWPLDRLTDRVLEAFAVGPQPRSLARAAMLFFYAGFVGLKGYYGMDAFLVLALGLGYLERVARRGLLAPGAGAAVLDGLWLGTLVLARVDSLPLAVAAFAVAGFAALPDRGGFGRLVGRAAAFAAVVGPYLAWNRLVFGDWLPISARLKSAFPQVRLASSLHTVLHSSLNPVDRVLVFVTLALAAGWCVAALREARARRSLDGPRQAMAVFAVYLVARIGWMLAFSRLDVQGSYFVLAHPFVALVSLLLARRLGGNRGVLTASLGVAAVTVLLAAAKLRAAVPEVRAIAAGRGDEWAIGRHVHDALTGRDVVYGGALGLIGFVADRAWINGDGVANDRAYQDAIRSGTLARHLAEEGVSHLAITVSPPRAPTSEPIVMRAESVLYGVADSLRADSRRILLREPMRRNNGSEIWLVRW